MKNAAEAHESTDREALERSRLRRERWTGGVALRGDAMDEVSAALWRSVNPNDRLGYVFDMWNEQTTLEDPSNEVAARSVGGVRPRKG